eukprot:2671597-Rhodomonas_salina.3
MVEVLRGAPGSKSYAVISVLSGATSILLQSAKVLVTDDVQQALELSRVVAEEAQIITEGSDSYSFTVDMPETEQGAIQLAKQNVDHNQEENRGQGISLTYSCLERHCAPSWSGSITPFSSSILVSLLVMMLDRILYVVWARSSTQGSDCGGLSPEPFSQAL